MHKLSIGLFLAAFIISCGGKKDKASFELRGTLSNSNSEMIYLERLLEKGPVVVDSTILNEKGEFEFQHYIPAIGFYRIRITQQSFAMLVLDSTDKVTITGDVNDLASTYKVDGSSETKLFLEYADIGKQRELKLDSLNKIFMNLVEPVKMDSLKVDSLSKTFERPYNAIVEPSNLALANKIKQNTDKYASLMGIQVLEPDNYIDLYDALDRTLSKKYPNDKGIKMFHNMVRNVISTGIGQLAPEIALTSPEGKQITLSSLRGKFVLVDFWASWCGPCRHEMPNVVKAYAKFKNKGFEIYGVSLDQDKDRWVEAITKDGITWPQVSDLKQWQSNVVQLYNIQGIPYTVLLDREGKILAKNLRGAELEAKLAEVLN